MSTCACDGTVSGIFQAAPDALYHAAGTTSPTEDAQTACAEAISILQARGLDPCAVSDADLQAGFAAALKDVQATVQGTPVFNNLQKWIDAYVLNTASTDVAVTPGKPGGNQTNTLFLIGAIVFVGIGFFLVFR